MLRPKTPADLDLARQQVDWIDEDDLRDVESKSPVGATLLGLFTWGGGRLYVGDMPRGIAGIVALIAWLTIGRYVPDAVGTLVYFLVGGGAAAYAYQGARRVNKLVATRNELMLRQGAGPEGYRLLAGAALIDPRLAADLPRQAPATGPHADLVVRLRKLAALRGSGVIDDVELRERKIDLLQEVAPASQGDLDDMMFALLPLRDEGVLLQEDFDFLKQVGGTK